jgi:hypothetical protein
MEVQMGSISGTLAAPIRVWIFSACVNRLAAVHQVLLQVGRVVVGARLVSIVVVMQHSSLSI